MDLKREIVIVVAAATLLAGGAALAGDAAGGKVSREPGTSATTARVADQVDGKSVESAAQPQFWFGVAVENISPGIARQLKLKSDQGLWVVAVLRDSPAEKAGLKAEDLLIAVDGKAITSQEELARAANSPAGGNAFAAAAMKASTITFLRDGDPHDVKLTPGLRPANMLVMGQNTQSFSPAAPRNGDPANTLDMKNYVLPNGNAAQVGPGYQMDLQGESSTVRVLRPLMNKKETVVMTEETDAAGTKKCTITVGTTKYSVEPGKLDALPASVRPLAEQFLANSGPAVAKDPPARDQTAIEQRVNELEKKNEMLMQLLQDLRQPSKQAPADPGGK